MNLCLNKWGEGKAAHLFTPSLIESLKCKKKKKSNLAWLIFCISKTECCFSGRGKEDNTAKDKPNDITTFSKRRRGVERKDKQVFTHFKGVSCNLSSIKLLINTRVALGSLSTLPHLHKIKGTRFPCHCLPIECQPFPQWGDLGPLGLTWGQSINTQLKRSATQSLQEKPQINRLLPLNDSLCWNEVRRLHRKELREEKK